MDILTVGIDGKLAQVDIAKNFAQGLDNQLGVLFAGGGFGFWTAVAILVDAFCIWAIVRPERKAER